MNKKPSKRQIASAMHGLYGIGEKPKERKPRSKPVQHEAELQQQCVKWYNMAYPKMYYSLWSTPNESRRSYRNANRLKAQGLTSGISDLILCVRGRTTFIELKRPDGKGRQTDTQREFQEHIESQGFTYHIVDSFDQFQQIVNGVMRNG